jgi:hypothetical protein
MKKLKKVQEHFKFRLTDHWSNECNFYIWEESTADGYSVFIATHNVDKINVNENVYYYDSDLADALTEFIKYIEYSREKQIIYIDDISAQFVEEAIEELNELINKKK